MEVSKNSDHQKNITQLKSAFERIFFFQNVKEIFLNTHSTFAFIVYGPYTTQLTTLMQMTGLTSKFARECEKYFYGKANKVFLREGQRQKSHPS